MQTVLIVDDEEDIVKALKIYLAPEGYELLEANNGKDALDIVKNKHVDLILMDIMMPLMDGVTATSKLRETSNIPIILLTAKSEDTDKVLGLNIGADDYITKPFNPMEVIARVKSQLRRYTMLGGRVQTSNELIVGGIVLDDNSKIVTVDGEVVSLTPVEYGILKLFMQNLNKVLSSEEIYEAVWNDEAITGDGVVAVHIRHLREKIEIDPSNPRYIKVVWGHGYKMVGSYEK
jgi:DNA-binding response OmpR family regulator